MSTSIRIATTGEKDIVQNIDQFYLYEFARFMPDSYRLGDDGLFHDEDYLPYWSDPNKYPYLIFSSGEKAGFALVDDQGDERVLSQFFVLYKFQGSGTAREAALQVFSAHPGRWIVQSLLTNPKSERFWPKLIQQCSEGTYSVDLQEPKRTHHVYRFSFTGVNRQNA